MFTVWSYFNIKYKRPQKKNRSFVQLYYYIIKYKKKLTRTILLIYCFLYERPPKKQEKKNMYFVQVFYYQKKPFLAARYFRMADKHDKRTGTSSDGSVEPSAFADAVWAGGIIASLSGQRLRLELCSCS